MGITVRNNIRVRLPEGLYNGGDLRRWYKALDSDESVDGYLQRLDVRTEGYLSALGAAAPGPRGVAECAALSAAFQHQRDLEGLPIERPSAP